VCSRQNLAAGAFSITRLLVSTPNGSFSCALLPLSPIAASRLRRALAVMEHRDGERARSLLKCRSLPCDVAAGERERDSCASIGELSYLILLYLIHCCIQ